MRGGRSPSGVAPLLRVAGRGRLWLAGAGPARQPRRARCRRLASPPRPVPLRRAAVGGLSGSVSGVCGAAGCVGPLSRSPRPVRPCASLCPGARPSVALLVSAAAWAVPRGGRGSPPRGVSACRVDRLLAAAPPVPGGAGRAARALFCASRPPADWEIATFDINLDHLQT